MSTHKYFRDRAGAIYAYLADGSEDEYMLPGMIALTPAEVHAHHYPPLTPDPVPQTITRAQGRLALYHAGLWPAVQSFVAAITNADEAFEADAALNHTTDWQRTSPFLNRAAAVLGLTDEQLDDLFREAAQIIP